VVAPAQSVGLEDRYAYGSTTLHAPHNAAGKHKQMCRSDREEADVPSRVTHVRLPGGNEQNLNTAAARVSNRSGRLAPQTPYIFLRPDWTQATDKNRSAIAIFENEDF
jgi:hypothetical protein